MIPKRVLAVFSMALAAVATISGCPTMPPVDSPGGANAPSAAKLFKTINETDPYKDWTAFPDLNGLLTSAVPHGPMTRVFINDIVAQAVADNATSLPGGSIIVKENIGENASDEADALTIMWKVKGFDPENSDWFWANITPGGTVRGEGRIDVCITCHGGARDNDFIFLHQFNSN